jgi:hypothetical protein
MVTFGVERANAPAFGRARIRQLVSFAIFEAAA